MDSITGDSSKETTFTYRVQQNGKVEFFTVTFSTSLPCPVSLPYVPGMRLKTPTGVVVTVVETQPLPVYKIYNFTYGVKQDDGSLNTVTVSVSFHTEGARLLQHCGVPILPGLMPKPFLLKKGTLKEEEVCDCQRPEAFRGSQYSVRCPKHGKYYYVHYVLRLFK